MSYVAGGPSSLATSLALWRIDVTQTWCSNFCFSTCAAFAGSSARWPQPDQEPACRFTDMFRFQTPGSGKSLATRASKIVMAFYAKLSRWAGLCNELCCSLSCSDLHDGSGMKRPNVVSQDFRHTYAGRVPLRRCGRKRKRSAAC